MLSILTGAMKNSGDFLIGSRAKELLKLHVDPDITEISRFASIEPSLGAINQSRALLLCGGPAYSSSIYPEIYPLMDDLERIVVPIIPFGLGWSGEPRAAPTNFTFSEPSKAFLDRVHRTITASSCRDALTLEILNRHGWDNVIMTGCPAWYHLPSIGLPLSGGVINQVVVTPPASPRLFRQCIALLSEVKRVFPSSGRHCVFHRGILPDRYTGLRASTSYIALAGLAWAMGYRVVDAAYGLEQVGFYADCDLHVGYRVHAHLDFLSRRKRSLLIQEDGRGLGMNTTLGCEELSSDDDELMSKLRRVMYAYRSGESAGSERAVAKIDETYAEMKGFLSTLST